jgi:hypothetical protein
LLLLFVIDVEFGDDAGDHVDHVLRRDRLRALTPPHITHVQYAYNNTQPHTHARAHHLFNERILVRSAYLKQQSTDDELQRIARRRASRSPRCDHGGARIAYALQNLITTVSHTHDNVTLTCRILSIASISNLSANTFKLLATTPRDHEHTQHKHTATPSRVASAVLAFATAPRASSSVGSPAATAPTLTQLSRQSTRSCTNSKLKEGRPYPSVQAHHTQRLPHTYTYTFERAQYRIA